MADDELPPVIFQWNGEAMVPRPRFAVMAARIYSIDVDYRMVAREERTIATHNHYFACLTSAWRTLPEDIGADFPTMEHLRKFALIKTGFYDQKTYVASSRSEARDIAGFIKPFDSYAVVTVQGLVVGVYTAQSQSMKAMGKARFQESKVKVLDYVADLIGVTTEQLSKSTKENAQ